MQADVNLEGVVYLLYTKSLSQRSLSSGLPSKRTARVDL